MGDMQSALLRLISAVPVENRGIRNAAALERALGIDRKLAWRVFKIANDDDSVAAGLLMPRKISIAKVSKAAKLKKVGAEIISNMEGAYSRYEQLVRDTAGNREVFDSMLSGLVSEAADPLDLVHKRASVRADTHLLGVHCEAILKTFIVRPSVDGQNLDTAVLGGLVRLKRLRAGVPLVISSRRFEGYDGEDIRPKYQPVDPESARKYGIPLLEAFCSSPVPRFEQRITRDGFKEVTVAGGGLGEAHSSTCFMADYARAIMSRHQTELDKQLRLITNVRTPADRLIFDVMMARGCLASAPPVIGVCSDHAGVRFPDEPQITLATRETIRRIPSGLKGISTPEIPQYPDIIAHVLGRLDWDPDEFDVYRCVVDYPVLPSSVMMAFELLPND
jgi:hypothetical protein